MGKHRPVNKTLAQQCVDKYKKIYKDSSDPAVQKCYTDGIIFEKESLIAWLNSIPNTSIKIAFGVYNEAYVEQYPIAKKGRLTAFLFPSDIVPHATVGGPIIAFAVPGGDPPTPTPPPPPPGDGSGTGGTGTEIGGDPLNMGDLLP